MLRPRIIPCLLVHKKGLVKTVQFANPKYVGDPINAVKIFNEKEVDELIVLDIDASVNGVEPNYTMIQNLAFECRMPFCYGGGVKTVAQATKIIKLGVEKVAISSAAVEQPKLITMIAEHIGSQSVVVVLDVKKNSSNGQYELCTHNGKNHTGIDAVEFAHEIESLGAGEVTINSIDNDGVMKGYDLSLAKKIREVVTIPMTVLGGAGSLNDIKELIQTFGIVGSSAGSLFVFKGVYKAVLINYPSRLGKEELFH
jgi:cyclase